METLAGSTARLFYSKWPAVLTLTRINPDACLTGLVQEQVLDFADLSLKDLSCYIS